jgi:excisionase family DNA binding protein
MRKTKVTVETHQVLVIRRGRHFGEDWCIQCCQQVKMITADEAAVLTGVSLRTICQRVEANKLHFKETGDGLLFICLNSLMQ